MIEVKIQNIEDALRIAESDLKGNVISFGNGFRAIVTGKFRKTPWSWDSFFASWGLLSTGNLKDYRIADDNLWTYAYHRTSSGLISRKFVPNQIAYALSMWFNSNGLLILNNLMNQNLEPSYAAMPIGNSEFINSFFQEALRRKEVNVYNRYKFGDDEFPVGYSSFQNIVFLNTLSDFLSENIKRRGKGAKGDFEKMAFSA